MTDKGDSSDLDLYWIELLRTEEGDDLRSVLAIIDAGFRHISRAYLGKASRWRRWRDWWTRYVAERNAAWALAATYLRRMLADKGVKRSDRVAAYAALGRALGRGRNHQSLKRTQALKSAVRLGAKHPDANLFSVVSQLESLGELRESNEMRLVFRFLAGICLLPATRVPRHTEDMNRFVRQWRRRAGVP